MTGTAGIPGQVPHVIEADLLEFEVRPGIIRTDMTERATEAHDRFIEGGGVPLGRWGVTDDVGKAVATIARGDGLPELLGRDVRLQLHRRKQQRVVRSHHLEPRRSGASGLHALKMTPGRTRQLRMDSHVSLIAQ